MYDYNSLNYCKSLPVVDDEWQVSPMILNLSLVCSHYISSSEFWIAHYSNLTSTKGSPSWSIHSKMKSLVEVVLSSHSHDEPNYVNGQNWQYYTIGP